MLTKREFQKLIMTHGPVTHYTITEGGKWYMHQNHASQYIPEMNTMQAMHSLRFRNGIEWDEINGVRS